MSATPLFDRYTADDPCASRHRGAETSEAAHDRIRESKAALRARILAFLERLGRHGATWYEISAALGIPYTNSGRVTELLASGEAVRTGSRRPTPSGCDASVIVARVFAP